MAKKTLPELGDLETVAEGHFTWNVEGWSKLPKRITSEVFTVGGNPW